MLQNSTIWESSSRPLSVRSVWLQSSNARVGYQRHFILDNEPRKRQHLSHHLPKSALSAADRRTVARSGSFSASLCSDLTEWPEPENLFDCGETAFLIDSAKLKLHDPVTPPHIKLQQKLHRHYRRPTFLPKQLRSFSRRFNDFQELFSRHSSLQNLQSTSLSNSHPDADERLAERVLNWLDLAGKTDFVKHSPEASELMEDMQRKLQKLRSAQPRVTQPKAQCDESATQKFCKSAIRYVSPHVSCPRPRPRLRPRPQQPQRPNRRFKSAGQKAAVNTPTSDSHHSKRPDSMRPITVIFDKDGELVRCNQPAGYKELCALASNTGMTRRRAGAIVSARFYQSAEPEGATPSATDGGQKHTGRDNSNNLFEAYMSGLQEPLRPPLPRHACSHEELTYSNVQQQQDAKKQLHIFLPNLPKKGLLAAGLLGNGSSTGGEDSPSVLSNNFSELCRI